MYNAKGHMIINGNITNKIYVKTIHFTVFKEMQRNEHNEIECFHMYFIYNISIDYHGSFGVIH